MGVLAVLSEPIRELIRTNGLGILLVASLASFVVLSIVFNVLRQLLFKNPHEPPVVFHWVPFFGSTIVYGIDPYKFFFKCRAKYGDVFTFILLGKKTTVCLGLKGNEFVLNGKLRDVNAEEIYTNLTTPVFGTDVVYDCPNAKLMEQKKFMKFGLTTDALRSYVPLIVGEVYDFLKKSSQFKGSSGTMNVPPIFAEITIYTASRSLQGKEVRDKFDSSFAVLYHDLDMGFSPINFMLPWAPLPHNRKRDFAQQKMAQTYMDIIKARREKGTEKDSEDMIWNLMSCSYRAGNQVPDREIAHMMIALLMAGQHSSSSTSAWIMLRLASRPDIMEELYQEQLRVLGSDLPPLTLEGLNRLSLNQQVVKETLRIHAPIHSIMRTVKTPMPVEGTPYVIPKSHVLVAAPGVTSMSHEHFPNPDHWDPHRWDAENLPVNKSEEEDEKIDYGYGLVSKGAKSPYLPFGAGRHRCIGEQFAYVQLGTITAVIVREFKLRNVEGKVGVPETDYRALAAPATTSSTVCNADNVLRDLRNPTRAAGASVFCSQYISKIVSTTVTTTAYATSYTTAVTTSFTTATSTITSVSTSTVLCPPPNDSTAFCGVPAIPNPDYQIIYLDGKDPTECHQLCLANPNCQSFSIDTDVTVNNCALQSVPSIEELLLDTIGSRLFYDVGCTDYLPDACRGQRLRKNLAVIEKRVTGSGSGPSTPSYLATVPASRISSACSCFITGPAVTNTITHTTSTTFLSATTTTTVQSAPVALTTDYTETTVATTVMPTITSVTAP
ncbi:MAG: Lanosterol 14-alpha-demethylase [Trizodia sp. TS-e1964]|nr:MAG: Lanosterol 14-alpha-demethylase [Trizodia sp. TS-e1964]